MDELTGTGVCCERGDITGFGLCPSKVEDLGRVQGSAWNSSEGGAGLWNGPWNVETTGREAGANLKCSETCVGG